MYFWYSLFSLSLSFLNWSIDFPSSSEKSFNLVNKNYALMTRTPCGWKDRENLPNTKRSNMSICNVKCRAWKELPDKKSFRLHNHSNCSFQLHAYLRQIGSLRNHYLLIFFLSPSFFDWITCSCAIWLSFSNWSRTAW